MMVIVGRIGRPHGVRGEVTIEVRTDDPESRLVVGGVLMTDPPERGPLTVRSVRHSGPRTLLRFEGTDDREGAQALRGTLLQLDAADLPESADDEFYDHELIGLNAVDTTGASLGTITAVDHPPAAPVLTVRRPSGADELVPFVAAIVPQVDPAGGTLTIDPPDGMFPEAVDRSRGSE